MTHVFEEYIKNLEKNPTKKQKEGKLFPLEDDLEEEKGSNLNDADEDEVMA